MRAVFFDVDTQLDFLYPAGALYVPGAERLVPVIARLNRYAAEHGITVISDTDAHTEDDPEFRQWPPHCVKGTLGQQKPIQTLLEQRMVIPNVPIDSLAVAGARQILLEKQSLDCFTNVNLPRLLQNLNADRYVVYGVVTEYCVSCAVLGLLKTGKSVEVIVDAVETLKKEDAESALHEFQQAGATLTTLEKICA